MRPRRTLAQWLAWQERFHPRSVDLGLERVARVTAALELKAPPYRVLTVAGTNGKGSSVAFAEALLRASGLRAGAYTSPHLLRYNERVRVDGRAVTDTDLVAAFEVVDAARGGQSLSYFEFGTLAALHLFREHRVEVAVLEVGMGGRLDAVNVVDPDVALVTSIGLDHLEWLGPDRESIGREKAGILRPDHPAVVSDPDPPRSVLERAARLGVPLRRIGADFRVEVLPSGDWRLLQGNGRVRTLPPPGIPGHHQYANAAGAVEAVEALGVELAEERMAVALAGVRLPGRFQRIAGEPELILDVAHNEAACAALAASLRREQPVRWPVVAVLGVLRDKRPADMVRRLDGVVDGWVVTTPPGPRALPAEALARVLRENAVGGPVEIVPEPRAALESARDRAGPEGRVVVFGSFLTVEAVFRAVEGAD